MKRIAPSIRPAVRTILPRYSSTPICKCLHTTIPTPATPLPVTAHGPPPKPPLPASPTPQEDRIERRRRQAELIRQGQALRAGEKGKDNGVKKRFWKDVIVHEAPEGLQIHLDKRPLRTPQKTILTIPHSKPHLASAIALEWDSLTSASQALKQHHVPLTSLVSRASEIAAQDTKNESRTRDEIISMAMRYLDTDTLLCWPPAKSNFDVSSTQLQFAEDKTESRTRESLREIQIRTAQPIMGFLTSRVWPGVELVPITDENSILPRPQPETTKAVIRGWMSGLSAYDLAALERGVLAGKSLLIAVRLVVEWSSEFQDLRPENQNARFGVEEAAEAASLEVNWQTGMWGEVEDTHDVDKEDLKRQLGSVILLVAGKE